MARFIGYVSAYKGDSDTEASRISATMVEATARGWNVGGAVHVHAASDDTKKQHRDTVRLSVDGGSNGTLCGYEIAEQTQTDSKPTLYLHLPSRHIMDHDFSKVVLVDDETNKETVIYTAPAAEGK